MTDNQAYHVARSRLMARARIAWAVLVIALATGSILLFAA